MDFNTCMFLFNLYELGFNKTKNNKRCSNPIRCPRGHTLEIVWSDYQTISRLSLRVLV